MILLCGIPSESPLAMVATELEALNVTYKFVNQRRALESWMSWEVAGGRITGRLALENEEHRLEDVVGVYTRLMDDRILPELESEPPNSPARHHCRSFHEALSRWYEVCPARVVNRAAPQGSNSSKPYQAQLIARYGFSIPETLITNQPDLVREFQRTHGQVIFKSISGVRSIVQILAEDDVARLDQIRWCPVQFQAFVPGTNVRVHTIGGEAFATEITSDVTDYRYASRFGGEATLRAIDLPDDVTQGCLDLAEGLGLPFVGIDLKLAPDGRVFCFEVNPSPAFSYYEANTGQPIARALAQYLAGA